MCVCDPGRLPVLVLGVVVEENRAETAGSQASTYSQCGAGWLENISPAIDITLTTKYCTTDPTIICTAPNSLSFPLTHCSCCRIYLHFVAGWGLLKIVGMAMAMVAMPGNTSVIVLALSCLDLHDIWSYSSLILLQSDSILFAGL